MTRIARSTALGLAAALALSGCAFGGSGTATPQSSGTATPQSSGTATPQSSRSSSPESPDSASPAPAATGATTASPSLPASCRAALGAAADAEPFSLYYASDAPPGSVTEIVRTPTTSAVGASAEEQIRAATSLQCEYMDPNADITSIVFGLGHLTPGTLTAYQQSLATDGYTCTAIHDGSRCTITTTEPRYRVDEGHTIFRRGDVFITVDQVNTPTNDLIGSFVSVIWG